MSNNNKIIPDCNPPHSCFNCPYDDCRRDGSVTKSETEYVKTEDFPKADTLRISLLPKTVRIE